MTTQTSSIGPSRSDGGYTFMRISGRTLIYLLVIVGAIVSMLPFFWTLSSSGKTPQEIYTYPPRCGPRIHNFLPTTVKFGRLSPLRAGS